VGPSPSSKRSSKTISGVIAAKSLTREPRRGA
jgi:hypothetical protein